MVKKDLSKDRLDRWYEIRLFETQKRASQLETAVSEDFNERAGDVHHSLVKFNNMLYALVQELRDEVTEYDLGWSRAEHGSITWGQWDNWHMHITINSDGNVNEYDEDGRCKNYPFENLGKPFMHDLFYLRDALEETFKVAKKLRVELKGKYM